MPLRFDISSAAARAARFDESLPFGKTAISLSAAR
jgi:hypothetical protein